MQQLTRQTIAAAKHVVSMHCAISTMKLCLSCRPGEVVVRPAVQPPLWRCKLHCEAEKSRQSHSC